MFKRIKENKKGFTLAELLIVVAIIGVLVAVSIPIFTAQLRKSRIATNTANVRAAKAALVADMLADGKTSGSGTLNVASGNFTFSSAGASASATPSHASDAGVRVWSTITVNMSSGGTFSYPGGNTIKLDGQGIGS